MRGYLLACLSDHLKHNPPVYYVFSQDERHVHIRQLMDLALSVCIDGEVAVKAPVMLLEVSVTSFTKKSHWNMLNKNGLGTEECQSQSMLMRVVLSYD